MSGSIRYVGSIPELYERYLAPMMFEPYACEVAERVPADARRVLEIAAGTGRVTRRLLARLAADAELIATDLSEAMIVEGARRLGQDARVVWRVTDMQALPFADASVDAVVCQFGLMFVPEKLRAMCEMRRVLRGGGVAVVAVWNALERNDASALLQELAFAKCPTDPPVSMRTPFSMPDPAELAGLARAAGFDEVRVETIAKVGEAASASELAIGFVRGNPLAQLLVERGVDADAFEREVAEALAARFGAAPCRSPLSAHVLTARAT